MNDRELLELAAKAAELNAEWKEYTNAPPTMVVRYKSPIDGITGYEWNPLTDDGDALRLAVKLDIHVKRYAGSTTAQELCSVSSWTEHDHWLWNQNDPMRSTRRAIVRAAAEIGKAMP